MMPRYLLKKIAEDENQPTERRLAAADTLNIKSEPVSKNAFFFFQIVQFESMKMASEEGRDAQTHQGSEHVSKNITCSSII